MRIIKGGALFIFLSGWLVPAWIGISILYDWFYAEVTPQLNGAHPMNSFPFLSFSKSMVMASGVWVSLAVLVLSYFAVIRLFGSASSESVNKKLQPTANAAAE